MDVLNFCGCDVIDVVFTSYIFVTGKEQHTEYSAGPPTVSYASHQ